MSRRLFVNKQGIRKCDIQPNNFTCLVYRAKPSKEKKEKKKKTKGQQEAATLDEDIVEDLVLSSDEDGSVDGSLASSEDEDEESTSPNLQRKQQKLSENLPKKRSRPRKSKKKNSAGLASSDGKGDKAKSMPPKQHGKKPKPPGILSKKNVRSQNKKRKRTN